MFSLVPFRTNLAKYNTHYDMQSKLLFTGRGQNYCLPDPVKILQKGQQLACSMILTHMRTLLINRLRMLLKVLTVDI